MFCWTFFQHEHKNPFAGVFFVVVQNLRPGARAQNGPTSRSCLPERAFALIRGVNACHANRGEHPWTNAYPMSKLKEIIGIAPTIRVSSLPRRHTTPHHTTAPHHTTHTHIHTSQNTHATHHTPSDTITHTQSNKTVRQVTHTTVFVGSHCAHRRKPA